MYKFYIPYLAAIIIIVNDIEHYLIANRSTSLLHVIITSTSELVTISSNCCNILFFFVKFSQFFSEAFWCNGVPWGQCPVCNHSGCFQSSAIPGCAMLYLLGVLLLISIVLSSVEVGDKKCRPVSR